MLLFQYTIIYIALSVGTLARGTFNTIYHGDTWITIRTSYLSADVDILVLRLLDTMT